MFKIIENFENKSFCILVSPPRHDAALFEAANQFPIDGIKVHLNVEHRASGTHFGTWEDEKPFISRIAATMACPVGVMPGAEHMPTETEMLEMARLGISFFDVYTRDLLPWMKNLPMVRMLAAGYGDTPDSIGDMIGIGADILEASVIDPLEYGKPLTREDLNWYQKIVKLCPMPVIVPSQKKLQPSDIQLLKRIGVRGVLLGTISLGNTPEAFTENLSAFMAEIQ